MNANKMNFLSQLQDIQEKAFGYMPEEFKEIFMVLGLACSYRVSRFFFIILIGQLQGQSLEELLSLYASTSDAPTDDDPTEHSKKLKDIIRVMIDILFFVLLQIFGINFTTGILYILGKKTIPSIVNYVQHAASNRAMPSPENEASPYSRRDKNLFLANKNTKYTGSDAGLFYTRSLFKSMN